MPDLAPPPEAAHDPYVLLLWVAGIAVLGLVSLFVIMLRREDAARKRQQIERAAWKTLIAGQFEQGNENSIAAATRDERLITLMQAALERVS